MGFSREVAVSVSMGAGPWCRSPHASSLGPGQLRNPRSGAAASGKGRCNATELHS